MIVTSQHFSKNKHVPNSIQLCTILIGPMSEQLTNIHFKCNLDVAQGWWNSYSPPHAVEMKQKIRVVICYEAKGKKLQQLFVIAAWNFSQTVPALTLHCNSLMLFIMFMWRIVSFNSLTYGKESLMYGAKKMN